MGLEKKHPKANIHNGFMPRHVLTFFKTVLPLFAITWRYVQNSFFKLEVKH